MKLEAIREDRTRGGRSTYQCSYTFPNLPAANSDSSNYLATSSRMANEASFKAENVDSNSKMFQNQQVIPTLLQVSNKLLGAVHKVCQASGGKNELSCRNWESNQSNNCDSS